MLSSVAFMRLAPRSCGEFPRHFLRQLPHRRRRHGGSVHAAFPRYGTLASSILRGVTTLVTALLLLHQLTLVGGMISSTVLTLVVIPAVYSLWKAASHAQPWPDGDAASVATPSSVRRRNALMRR